MNPITIDESRSMLTRLLISIIVVLGLSLRACHLDYPSLWVDEAESSINALTILEHGYPTDHYLGLPIFENTLIKKWPEHEEYEYRDISYSDTGVAVYHSWLPLYAIASSLYLFGITPDQIADKPKVLHGREAWSLRTLAPRVPSIVFSLVFLICFYYLAKELYSRDAALAALMGAAITDGLINYGRYARYYSATLALVTLCGLLIWRLTKRQCLRDFVFTALTFVLLFHTHTLSFLIMAVVLIAVSPSFLMGERIFRKLLVFTGIVGMGTIPWAVYTGFFTATIEIPKAWPLLHLPSDLLRFPLSELAFMLPVVLGLSWLLVVWVLREYLPARLIRPFSAHTGSFLFLAFWSATGFLSFLLLIPAASFFEDRLNIVTVVPGLLLFAMVLAAVSRVIFPRFAGALPAILMLITLVVTNKISFQNWDPQPHYNRSFDLIKIMETWDLNPGTRIYSTPNQHLVLTYYSGLPVQSIAPVRKSFLDRTDSDIIVINTLSGMVHLPIERTIEEARHMGIALSEEEARELLEHLNVVLVRQQLDGRVAEAWPSKRTLSPLEKRIALQQALYINEILQETLHAIPITRGYNLSTLSDLWYVFLYRFSDLEAHWRENRNYLDRIRDSTALVLPWGWIIYDSGHNGPVIFTSEDILHRTFEKASRFTRHSAWSD